MKPTRRHLLPLALPAILVLLISTACRQDKPGPPAGPKTYTVRGVVVALDPKVHTATLKHEKIEGWMAAMTMEFPVKDPAEFAKLTVGAQITATLYVNDLEYYLGNISTHP